MKVVNNVMEFNRGGQNAGRLEKSVYDLLNAQMMMEFQASNIYLQMSAWAQANDLDGTAKFLLAQSNEEREHMQKIFDYLLERNATPVLGSIDAPQLEYVDIQQVFDTALEEECKVTESIDTIVLEAWNQKDMATFQFLQWFVEEQREEEAQAHEILGKIGLLGTDGQGLHIFDQWMSDKSA